MSEKRSNSEKTPDNMKGQVLFNKYKLIQKIGEGSFGSVYTVQSIYSHKLYAAKLEQIKDSNVLEEESLNLSCINSPRVPKVKLFGYSGQYMVLVMELLGPSLDLILNSLPDKKMSIRCVCNIAYQLISILETIHNNGFIHRDIKPSNINIGIGNKGKKFLYLIDFGLSKKYRCSSTKKHYPFEEECETVGNARYSSINTLEGHSQSRRDDLESLGYVLVYLCLGRLPWQGKISHSKDDKYYKIREIKKNISLSLLCQNLPPQFEEYIKYTRNLEYEDDPDYSYLKNLFLTVLKNNNLEFDYYYDWDKTTLTNDEVVSINNSLSSYTYSNQEKRVTRLYSRISELKKEKEFYGDNFEIERFVYDIENDSNCYSMNRRENISRENNDDDLYANVNSMAPTQTYKKKIKTTGCLPCQPKAYREDDNSCCIIF